MRLAGALTWWRPFDHTATMVTKGYAVGRLARSEPDVPPHGRPQVLHGRRRIPARPVNLDISSGVSTDLAQRAPAREGRARGGKIIRLHTPKVTGDGHVPPGQVDRAADRIRCPLPRGQRTPERDRGPDCPASASQHGTAHPKPGPPGLARHVLEAGRSIAEHQFPRAACGPSTVTATST